MNSEQIEEWAALEAVGALEGESREAFHAYLAQADAAQKAEISDFNDLVGLLAKASFAQCPPPPELKGKVMQRICSVASGESPKQPEAAKPDNNSQTFSFIRKNEGEWKSLPVKGARAKELVVDPRRGYTLMLMELDAGVEYPGHHHSGPEDCFVLSGDLHAEGEVLYAGDFHHAEGGSDHGISFTENGCQLLLVVQTQDY